MGLLGLGRVLDHLDLREDAVDAELDGQAGRLGLQVHVARADHQRVAQRRAHEPHHLARFVADRLERQVLDAAAVRGPADDFLLDGVERAQRLFVPGGRRHQVAAVNQAPAEGRLDALLRPRLQLRRRTGRRRRAAAARPCARRARSCAAALREGQQVRRWCARRSSHRSGIRAAAWRRAAP